jgi:bifunctional non-homologous end joining protein LigD
MKQKKPQQNHPDHPPPGKTNGVQGLSTYGEKRDFSLTPEPRPRQVAPSERNPQLVFAVQKHQASHLHYDLRLEVRGILKSWAIPKGPSMNPHESRLAIETENHPYAYKDFEGSIPEGNYGAGDVIVWDKGWYEPVGPGAGPSDRMVRGLRRGAIRFILHGKKLKGGFSLVRFRAPDQWLITKRDDMYAREDEPVTEDDSSVLSRRRLSDE